MYFNSVTVCGGARGIGLWFAKQLAANNVSNQVRLVDLDDHNSTKEASNCKFTHIDDFTASFSVNDLIVIAVPVDQVENLCKSLKNQCKFNNAVVINLCSVQQTTYSTLANLLPSKEIIGLHFLFGPDVREPVDNTIAIVKDKNNNSSQYIEDWRSYFKKMGFNILTLNHVEHDELMQHVQVAIHFLYFGFAQYLVNQDVSLEKIENLLTPIAKIYLGSISHTLLQTKETYSNIQKQHNASQTRKKVVKALGDCDSFLDSNKALDYLEALPSHFSSEALKRLQLLFKP